MNIDLAHQVSATYARNNFKAVNEQAIRDALTGLFNGPYGDAALVRAIEQAAREGQTLALVMIDVDHFRHINEAYGHQAGDQVLVALGALLRDDMCAEDVACRYGGEEFLVLLPHMSPAAARERAEDWRRRFAELVVHHAEAEVRATISLGVAAYPNHGHSAEELAEAAHLALYLAKHDGRNRVVVFEATPLALDA